MPAPADGLSSGSIRDGWAALREGRWRAAYDVFEAALAAEESPEACEGLSWAAWWLDDEGEVFRRRADAYRLYRSRGDAPGAARMATWLAADELDFHGAAAVANGWLRRAHRLLAAVDVGPDHGWLAFHDGYLAHAAGDIGRARDLGVRAAEIGRQVAVPDLEMLGLALEGAARVAGAQVEAGLQCLDEATAAALEGDATIPISGAWACCFMVGACTAVLDYNRAFEWCDRIDEFAARHGSRYMLAFCRAEYGTVHLWRGRWDEAEKVLQASIADFSRSRPAFVPGPRAALAELRRRQGRPAEAERLLDLVGPLPQAALCRARLALDRGEIGRAVAMIERVLRQIPTERQLDRVPYLLLLAEARTRLGHLDAAESDLASLRGIEGQVGTSALRATVDLVEGMLHAARGDHDRAHRLLEDAVDRFDRGPAPFEAAQARLELAVSLFGLGQTDSAAREAGSALHALAALGAAHEAARARRLLSAVGQPHPGGPAVTPREREVLDLLASGLTNRQIADRLVVSEHTVHRHVTNILRKLDLPSRTAAAAFAVRAGILEGAAPR